MSPGQESVDKYLAGLVEQPWTAAEIGKLAEKIQAVAYQAGYLAAREEYIPVLMKHLQILAELQDKVEALPRPRMTNDAFVMDERWDLWRGKVLALIKEVSGG